MISAGAGGNHISLRFYAHGEELIFRKAFVGMVDSVLAQRQKVKDRAHKG